MKKINFPHFPKLKTEKLILRELSPLDINEIFAIRSNKQIAKYLDRPLYRSIDQAKEFIEKITAGIKNGEWIYWAISLNNKPELIGTICLWQISEDGSKADIGFELLPDYQGKGYMFETVKEVVKFGFQEIGLDEIEGEVAPGNEASISLMKKFGFKLSAENEDNSDTIIYTLRK